MLRAVTHFVLVLSFPAAFVLAWDWHQAPLEGSLVVLGTAALSMALMSFAPKLRSFYGLEWRDYAVNQAGVAVVFAGALLAALTRR